MDYKALYLEAFKKRINEIDLEIISKLKASRRRNKKFLKLSNNISNELGEKEDILRTSLIKHFPDLIESFLQRFEEYESDHLTSFFTFNFPEFSEIYSAEALSNCASELGAYNGCSRAANNFSNSTAFFKAIYTLDKNYNHISLAFDPNENPMDSDLFHSMQKEIFPGYGQESDWEEGFIREIESEASGEKVKPEKKVKNIKPGDSLNKSEKLYILHLLLELTNQGSDMKPTEYLRILHLTVDVIDTSADITGKAPNYRKVKEGFFKNHPRNKKIKLIESVMSKLHRYQMSALKIHLDDKLKALTKK